MSAIKIRRRATTPKGFLRRIKDADLSQVRDPRNPNRIKHPMEGALELGTLSLTAETNSTRGVEDRSTECRPEVKGGINLEGKISDNAFGELLRRPEPSDLNKAVHRQVRAEWDRENLRPTRLKFSTVAVDGKCVATLDEGQIRHWIDQQTPLDGDDLSVIQLRHLVESHFPAIQIQNRQEGLVGLIRVHRVTLVSSEGAVVLHQQVIEGSTNEWGTIEQTLRGLDEAYGRRELVELVVMDAGNSCKKAAKLLCEQQTAYLMAIKGKQGGIHEQAVERLGDKSGTDVQFTHTEEVNGQTRTYSVWTAEIEEGLEGWKGARQLVRIERVTVDNDGETSVGNRYFVASVGPAQLDAEQAAKTARSYWRCENEGHWTYDAIWNEDATRTPWSTHPTGILNVGLLRILACNIMAMLRALSRDRDGDQWITPSWGKVIEYAKDALFEPRLETSAFDTFGD